MTSFPTVDFTEIRSLPGGQREAFEEFCCQIFSRASEADTAWKFRRIKPAAADFDRTATSAEVIIEATLQPNATQAELEAVQHSIRKALDSGVNCENLLRGDLIRNHGQNADSPGFRQFEAEYNVRFPAGPLDISRELLAALRRADNYFRASVARLAISSRMLITGPSGIGKTHAIVDYALMRFERRQPSLVLFGEDFSVDEPWVTIAAKLGFGAINRPQLFAMMDAAAEAAGAFLIIFIDALNETKPDRHRWQIWLPALSAELERHAHLKLCISCRDTYLRGGYSRG